MVYKVGVITTFPTPQRDEVTCRRSHSQRGSAHSLALHMERLQAGSFVSQYCDTLTLFFSVSTYFELSCSLLKLLNPHDR